MGSRLLVVAVAAGTILSALVLGVMLAAPFLPQSGAAISQQPATPGATIVVEPSADPEIPPLGLFQMRDFSFGLDRCLAIELTPASYPLGGPEQAGTATVLTWDRGITDPGHPDRCATRAGELESIDAEVFRIFGEGSQSGTVIGYAIHFQMTIFDAPVDPGLTILARQSTQNLLQVTNTLDPGSGLVFDRVDAVDPPLASPPPSGS